MEQATYGSFSTPRQLASSLSGAPVLMPMILFMLACISLLVAEIPPFTIFLSGVRKHY